MCKKNDKKMTMLHICKKIIINIEKTIFSDLYNMGFFSVCFGTGKGFLLSA